jgi:hypothetical protein
LLLIVSWKDGNAMFTRIRLVVLAAALVAAGSVFAGSARADNIPFGGGTVQHAPTFYAVYWLPSGKHFEPDDGHYEDQINQFLTDVSRTNLANVVSQYYDAQGSVDMTDAKFGGSWVDTSDFRPGFDGSAAQPLVDEDIQDQVNNALAANLSWQRSTNATVFVFTPGGINMCFADRSQNGCTPAVNDSAKGCGYHSHMTDASNNTIIYAGLPEAALLAGVGCGGTGALPQGDRYSDTEISPLSHELFEAATDPEPGTNLTQDGWLDVNGGVNSAEIGDKCLGQWGSQPWFGPSGYNVDGRLYYMQEEWSNITGQCEGDNAQDGFFQVYGPFVATAGVPTGTLVLAKTGAAPDLVGAPSPTINWGDGSITDVSPVLCASGVCDLNTNGHTYAHPGVYTTALGYWIGCCIPKVATITIKVFAQALTITPHDQTISYGDPAPDFTATGNIDYTGLRPGDTVTGLTCVTKDANKNTIDPSTAPVTEDAYTIQCSNAVAPPAYTITYTAGHLTINPAPLTITAKDQTTTYGSADKFDTSPNSMTFTGFKNGESPTVLSGLTITSHASATSPVGTYTLTPAAERPRNYTVTSVSGTLHVVPAPLTVTGDDASRPFGQANPTLTATSSGFVNGETLATSGVSGTAACSTTATPWSPVGSYPIDCTVGTLAAHNYSFSAFVRGTLNVTSTAPCQTGTVNHGLNVPAGQVVCLAASATVRGPVNVAPGGALDVEGASVTGPITASGASVVRLCGATVTGPLTIQGSTGLVLVGGDAATGACAPNTINGPVTIINNTGGVEINDNTITGPLRISGTTGSLPAPDTGSVHAVGNVVSGPVRIEP